jgi:RNA polymerase sigma-70 factor (ECF subfamily)
MGRERVRHESSLSRFADPGCYKKMMVPRPASSVELAERHRPALLRYLVRLLGNEDDAEDACQEALLRAHRAFDRLRPDSNARAWLYRIATNTALDAARTRARARAMVADADLDALPGASSAAERAELRSIARAVEALPARQRAALVLRRFEGLQYAEIATAVGGSAESARANVYQAMKKLRAVLGGA